MVLYIIGVIILATEAFSQNPVLSISTAKLPTGQYFGSAVYDGSDIIYILGGDTGSKRLNTILKFNINTEVIETVGTLQSGISGLTAFWGGTDVVTFGGYTTSFTSSIRRYAPGTVVSQPAGSLPTADAYSTLVAKNKDAYIFGGEIDKNKIIKYSNYIANEVEGSLLPYEVSRASSILNNINGKHIAYIFGGESYGSVATIIKYNIETGESSVILQTLPFPLINSAAVFNGTYAYIIGGKSTAGNPTGVIRFNPFTEEVITQAVVGFPDQLQGPAVAFVPKLNRAYIFGGRILEGVTRNEVMYLTF